jgi:hypothetical protein
MEMSSESHERLKGKFHAFDWENDSSFSAAVAICV